MVVLYWAKAVAPMKKHFHLPFVCLALGLSVPALAQLPSLQPDRVSLKIIQTGEAAFPLSLRLSSVLEGEAWVAINIDIEGKLVDYLVTGYSRKEFADSAVEALKRWEYKPARLNGESWPSIQEIHFSFSRTGVVVDMLGFEALGARLDELIQGMYVYRTYALRELDRIPTPIEVVSPISPKLTAQQGPRSVTVEFYISEDGRVRLPAVKRHEADDIYAASAMAAVKQWRFEPPLHKGRPVLVLARQQFNFVPEAEGKEQK